MGSIGQPMEFFPVGGVLWFLVKSPDSQKIFFEFCYIKPNLDCKYTFLIDLTSSRIALNAKSIEKSVITIENWFNSTVFRNDRSVCRFILLLIA